jgi:hypothetical protein
MEGKEPEAPQKQRERIFANTLYAWQAKVLFAIWNSIIPFCQSVREHPY